MDDDQPKLDLITRCKDRIAKSLKLSREERGNLNGDLWILIARQPVEEIDPEQIIKKTIQNIEAQRKRSKRHTEIHVENLDSLPSLNGNRRIRPYRSSNGQSEKPRRKERLYLPEEFSGGRNPFPNRKLKYLPETALDLPFDLEQFDSDVLESLGDDRSLCKRLDDLGGEGTCSVLRMVMKLAPVKISSKEIASRLRLSQRTVERRRAWVRRNVALRTSPEGRFEGLFIQFM
jgi:hypothetical protein